jgi:hypothetical protein
MCISFKKILLEKQAMKDMPTCEEELCLPFDRSSQPIHHFSIKNKLLEIPKLPLLQTTKILHGL